MYLQKLFDEPRANFVYGFGFDEKTNSFIFKINERVADFFSEKINPSNLILRYAQEKLHAGEFEGDIRKNFGFGNVTQNNGIQDGCIILSIQVANGVTIKPEPCPACDGIGIRFERVCSICHGTKKLIERNIDLRDVSNTLYILFNYLNFSMIDKYTKNWNHKGFQHLYLETAFPEDVYRTIGLGSNVSDELIEVFKNSDVDYELVGKAMYDCSLAIDGYLEHPEWEVRKNIYEFRCVMRDSGAFYLEVPGVNGCSFYLSSSGIGKNPLSCHNVDTRWQAILLLVGFGKLCSLVDFAKPITVIT